MFPAIAESLRKFTVEDLTIATETLLAGKISYAVLCKFVAVRHHSFGVTALLNAFHFRVIYGDGGDNRSPKIYTSTNLTGKL